MRFVALAILITVTQACAGLQFHDTDYNPEQLRDELWNVADGVSLWEMQPVELPLMVYVTDPGVESRAKRAIDAWNDALGDEVLRMVDVDGDETGFDIAIVDASEDDDPGRNPNMNGITQLMPAGGLRVEVVPVIVLFNKSNETLMHEIGHALGLDHDELERDSIMFPYSSGRILPEIEAIDVAVLQWVFDI